jgi:hypothetical protein
MQKLTRRNFLKGSLTAPAGIFADLALEAQGAG